MPHCSGDVQHEEADLKQQSNSAELVQVLQHSKQAQNLNAKERHNVLDSNAVAMLGWPEVLCQVWKGLVGSADVQYLDNSYCQSCRQTGSVQFQLEAGLQLRLHTLTVLLSDDFITACPGGDAGK